VASDDPLRAGLIVALGKRPSIALRRQIVEQLRAFADEQERIADAEARDLARPAAARLRPRKDGAGPGRAPGDFIRIERIIKESAGSARTADVNAHAIGLPKIRVHVGRDLYYAISCPARLDVQLERGVLRLVPVAQDGFAVTFGSSVPRFFCSSVRGLLKEYPDGRYAAEVQNGAIVIGEPK